MALSGTEKETILLFNEAEAEAHVYTYNGNLKRKLESFAQMMPSQVRLTARDATGAVSYVIPKSLILIRKPYSAEYREALRKRALERDLRPPIRRKVPK